jgi:hypothetical protein
MKIRRKDYITIYRVWQKRGPEYKLRPTVQRIGCGELMPARKLSDSGDALPNLPGRRLPQFPEQVENHRPLIIMPHYYEPHKQ